MWVKERINAGRLITVDEPLAVTAHPFTLSKALKRRHPEGSPASSPFHLSAAPALCGRRRAGGPFSIRYGSAASHFTFSPKTAIEITGTVSDTGNGTRTDVDHGTASEIRIDSENG
ncbi:hypothetical protein EVAR_93205_1 [Eumeta japonica]|uniref:Uncharacterized protein n=1 Tax=Eumeta variegata TaxID=151549 RepID=A0A4C1TXN7_EUMVA|nr:hypothetical protein EVAR_93205_1 [Eumeta japonica]